MSEIISNIVFVGGIHGVGKSTICKNICEKLAIDYLSASEVLKWSKLNKDTKNKKVENINYTQNLLINGLKEHVKSKNKYLLDGHYCLLNSEGNTEKIPFNNFEKINPRALCLIITDVAEIQRNLENRDKRKYDYFLLKEMQETEIKHAEELSVIMKVPILISEKSNAAQIQTFIKNIFT